VFTTFKPHELLPRDVNIVMTHLHFKAENISVNPSFISTMHNVVMGI